MFEINKRRISRESEPYIIAELSANHNGSLAKAKKSIEAAKLAGADAVKIQTYTPDTMTIKCDNTDFLIKEGLWQGYTLYDLYQEAHTPFEWHEELFLFAKTIDITLFSSPFDETAVELLNDLNVPAYKLASFELCDLPLIKCMAQKKKPILMSTGMGTFEEIKDAVKTAKENGCHDILLFHCISSYPTPIEDTKLKNLIYLKEQFEVEVGLSDHSFGNTAAIASIALGAVAIEKHFTLNRGEKSPDSEFSIEPSELSELKKITTQTWLALGSASFERPKIEEKSKIFRRSLYFINNLKTGEKIGPNDIRRIRPGYGISPKYQEIIIGKKVLKDVQRGEPVKWDSIS